METQEAREEPRKWKVEGSSYQKIKFLSDSLIERRDQMLREAERVTKEQITARIKDVKYTRLTETLTHCNITLDNGFNVTGESACVNPENYNQEIGEKIAHDNAFNKLWPLFGFLLAEKNFVRAETEKTFGDSDTATEPAAA